MEELQTRALLPNRVGKVLCQRTYALGLLAGLKLQTAKLGAQRGEPAFSLGRASTQRLTMESVLHVGGETGKPGKGRLRRNLDRQTPQVSRLLLHPLVQVVQENPGCLVSA